MNLVTLVGRLTQDPTIEEIGDKKIVTITLAISRDCKNTAGIYETDFIPCVLWNGIADKVEEFCNKGDCIGIKGKLQVIDNQVTVIADKVSFISKQRSEE